MNRRGLLIFAMVAALVPGLAAADGPTLQNVALTVEVAAVPAEVWNVIGDFQDMSWHPVVYATAGENANQADATRILTLGAADGPTILEALDSYDAESMAYSYRITDVAAEVLPVTNYTSRLSVAPRDGGGSLIEWRGAFYRADPGNDPVAGLDDAAAIAAITGVYQAGLDALIQRFGVPGA
jgi:hypothetical protein